MKKLNLRFEKLFASQISEMANKFPEKIVNALWEKKDLLKNKIESLNLNLDDEIGVPFVPIIPARNMSCIAQVAHLVYYSQSRGAESEIYYLLNSFFYNEQKAYDLSRVSQIGFLLDIKFPSISSLKIPANTKLSDIGSSLQNEIKKLGYIPANHVEAYAIACLTNCLPSSNVFCAINFSWDGYEFPKIFHGRSLKYGLDWITPNFTETGEYIKPEKQDYEVLIPIYKEVV